MNLPAGKESHARTGARFAGVGAINTVFGLLIIYAGKYAFGMGDVAANACGYGAGLVLSFFLNRNWTFRHTGEALPAFLRFLLVTVVAYVLNLSCVMGLIKVVGMNGYVAQAVGIVPYALGSYFGSRYFAFRIAAAGVQTSPVPAVASGKEQA